MNKVTERDAYSLLQVTNTLDKLRDARYLSSLDIISAYWQVALKESSKPITAREFWTILSLLHLPSKSIWKLRGRYFVVW